MEILAAVPTTIPPILHSTSSTQLMEVGSSSMPTHFSEAPRVFEFTYTYEKGKRRVFVPKYIKIFLTLDTIIK